MSTGKHRLDERAEREALVWVTRQNAGTLSATQQAQFDAWLAGDPRRAAALAYMTELWAATNLLSQPSFKQYARVERGAGRVGRRWHFGALGAMLMAGLAFFAIRFWPQPSVFETRVGEVRHVVLSDRSVLDIGPATALSVSYTKTGRRIDLRRGEVLFDVARSSTRPFVVVSGDCTIRVVGTQFNVHSGSEGVTVSVLKGAVRLDGTVGPVEQHVAESAALLRAGDQAVYGRAGIESQVRLARPEQAASWRAGYLEFHNDSLARVVDELNRFGEGSVFIEDADIASYRVTAVIRTGDPASAARNLEKVLPIQVVTLGAGKIALRARPKP